jgi:hypothetical protein
VKAVLSLRMAYRHTRASIDRAALSIIAVALGVALVTAVRLMNAAVLSSFMETVDSIAGQAALSITAGPGLSEIGSARRSGARLAAPP